MLRGGLRIYEERTCWRASLGLARGQEPASWHVLFQFHLFKWMERHMRACVQEGRVMFGNTCLDEDLITPISDNDYVLKGSEIIPFVFDYPLKSYAEKSSCLFKDEVEPPYSIQEASFQLHKHFYPKKNIDIQTKISPEMSQESQSFLLKKVINKDKNAKELASSTTPSSFSSSYSLSPPQQTRLANDTTKRNSSASSNMFRNLITCGVVNTNDAVVVMLNPANKTYSSKSNSSQAMIMADHRISKGDHKLAGRSAGVSGTCQNPQELPQQPHTASSYDGEKDANKQQKEREFSGQKAASAAYRPIGRPHCS
ncbi:hypothetical protein ACFX15_028149 [Malus domestica]